ncbi:tyrosine-protein phosphatase required for protection against superoxide stress (By similarity) [Boothiomyces sp. JEL0866]|nr:tyrosine-protein phosphatase required for protection against superoxide stress (By similarity) [Boothiomyces sp. JEL0866]
MQVLDNSISQHYIPPPNYGMVENKLYRSGQPNELNFPFLEKLELKTIIFLGMVRLISAPEDPNQKFLNFIDDQEIAFHHLGYNATMVMCNLGRHRTGTVVGCLRKLQRWNLTAIFEEYRRYAGPKVRILSEQFIELFDIELVRVPLNHPQWL